MKVTLLGTGDAIGTPKIGCSCPVCTFARTNGRQRLRSATLIEVGEKHILVDTGPDLRAQLMAAGSPHIDAVIWTHGHYDHFMGYGEFYRVQKIPPVYAAAPTMEYAGSVFSFLPLDKHTVEPYRPFDLFGARITLFPVNHPPMPTFGVRVEYEGAVLALTADTSARLSRASKACLSGADLLVLDTIVPEGFTITKHMNYADALQLAEELAPAEFRCTHASHLLAWDTPHLAMDMEQFEL
ncbi:MBL fold metallo-hydrolase [Methanofollis aquaemaris]|uniref:MBL fold metallo-hydrolase n=1 Tax=Methanofollis aquaemaris TaxID=126734 RepID=A0A8A3S6Y7_9EURY|nr:MBL fold metallo-hydrolase [Methanofollis aquaemaris]QSZ67376.1 MBL fold metallo-hydrolase [Methanofollis aquaemaris]